MKKAIFPIKKHKKPAFLYKNLTDEQEKLLDLSQDEFCEIEKNRIETVFIQHQLQLRFARNDDVLQLADYIAFHLKMAKVDASVNTYELYRMVEFGYGLILEKENRIHGCIFGICYDTPDKSAYAARLVVSRSLRGNNFGSLLKRYIYLLSYQNGSQVMRGLFDQINHKVTALHLNRHGGIFDSYDATLAGWEPFFTSVLWLSNETLLRRELDFQKVNDFMQKTKKAIDYELISIHKTQPLQQLYNTADMKVIGQLPATLTGHSEMYLAIAENYLQE